MCALGRKRHKPTKRGGGGGDSTKITSVAGIYAVTVRSAEIIGQFSKTTGTKIPSVKTVNPQQQQQQNRSYKC